MHRSTDRGTGNEAHQQYVSCRWQQRWEFLKMGGPRAQGSMGIIEGFWVLLLRVIQGLF